jgi:PiT family inorganic phosphate transporter
VVITCAVKWGVVERIIWAWIFTLPACGLMGYFTQSLCTQLGYR